VAAGLSGPCRVTHGGVRDFILGIKFIDGSGNLIRGGGKVVKNAAGFDLPKFFVGSAGRFGVLVEMTFKVFPMPAEHLTLSYRFDDLRAALQAMIQISLAPLQIEALDLLPPIGTDAAGSEPRQYMLLIRLGGDSQAIEKHAFRVDQTIGKVAERVGGDEEAQVWSDAREFRWRTPDQILVKVPITPKRIVNLESEFGKVELRRRYSVAGNVAWLAVAVDQVVVLDQILKRNSLAGLTILGKIDSPHRLGLDVSPVFLSRVKQALDPLNKFGELF